MKLFLQKILTILVFFSVLNSIEGSAFVGEERFVDLPIVYAESYDDHEENKKEAPKKEEEDSKEKEELEEERESESKNHAVYWQEPNNYLFKLTLFENSVFDYKTYLLTKTCYKERPLYISLQRQKIYC